MKTILSVWVLMTPDERAEWELRALLCALAERLEDQPSLTRAGAYQWFCSRRAISKVRFKFEVWPTARQLAGLPREGAPGRPRKPTK
jgi:hypothetical protein